MRIHYMNCGTIHPRLAGLFVPQLDRVPCLCLLVETPWQLVLVDTGLGTRDMEDPGRLGISNVVINARPAGEQPAVRQIERLGFRPEDVGHVICTHLDRDHAGGLPDFPRAWVHVSREELDAALNPADRLERDRYRECHFAHGPRWIAHETGSEEPWFGLECVRELDGLPPEILVVPLPGHTRGHCGVAIDTGEGWVLHCGDAYYVRDELREDGKAPVGIRAFRRVAHHDHSKAMDQIDLLRAVLERGRGRVATIAAHDKGKYEDIFGKPLD